MATNPIGKGTKTIGINMSKKMADELENGLIRCTFLKANTARLFFSSGWTPAKN